MMRTVTWCGPPLLFEGAASDFPARECLAAHLRTLDHAGGRGHRISTRAWRASFSPLAQVLASVPASAFYPVLLIGLVSIGGGVGIGSIALMLLGTQWYILFNVIAGAMSIPSDLREVTSLFHFTRWQRWTTADPSRHLSLPDHRHGYGFGWRVERVSDGGVFAREGPDASDHRTRRANQFRHR